MIPIWFLVLSLIFPRISILIAWLASCLPFWAAPWLVKFIMAALIPRILILIYIATIMGLCAWFWIHLGVFLFIYFVGTVKVTAKR